MKRVVIGLIFLFMPVLTDSQNYIEYHRTIHRIDNDVLAMNYKSAIERLDSIYAGYGFIYARHCIKALQICVTVNDSVRADQWLWKALVQGVPLWMIRANELTQKSLLYSTTQNTIENAANLNAMYRSSIDENLSRRIDSLFAIDQKYTRRVNDGFILLRYTIYGAQWIMNNKRQFKIIKEIIDHYGFPGEQLIGFGFRIEDSTAIGTIQRHGPTFIDEKRAFLMLIHFFTSHQKDINDQLLQNVIGGYLPAYHFGALNDFMAKRRPKKYQYYNVWHCDSRAENVPDINQRRHAIGLNTVEEQLRNHSIHNERRKLRTLNSEILLE